MQCLNIYFHFYHLHYHHHEQVCSFIICPGPSFRLFPHIHVSHSFMCFISQSDHFITALCVWALIKSLQHAQLSPHISAPASNPAPCSPQCLLLTLTIIITNFQRHDRFWWFLLFLCLNNQYRVGLSGERLQVHTKYIWQGFSIATDDSNRWLLQCFRSYIFSFFPKILIVVLFQKWFQYYTYVHSHTFTPTVKKYPLICENRHPPQRKDQAEIWKDFLAL